MKKSRMVIKVDPYGSLMINRNNYTLIVFIYTGVFKTRNDEIAKWRNDFPKE